MPLVSIIIPVFNVEKYLCRCLDSIVSQTFSDYEAIIVDDGSSDESGRICDGYAHNDKRFVVIHKQNEGVAKARLTAYEHSKGDLITFVDADDYVDSQYIEKLVQAQKEHNADMVSCQYYTDENGILRTLKRNVKGFYNREGIDKVLQERFFVEPETGAAGIPIFLWTKLVKREFVEEALKVGKGLKWSEDMVGLVDLYLRISSMNIIEDPLYYYVKREGQVTQKYSSDLWYNHLDVYQRFLDLDSRNMIEDQVFKRMWKFSYKATSLTRMPNVFHNCKDYCNELKKISKHPSWKKFFNSRKQTGEGLKDNLKFWLLKYSFFQIYYRVFIQLKNRK